MQNLGSANRKVEDKGKIVFYSLNWKNKCITLGFEPTTQLVSIGFINELKTNPNENSTT